MSIMVKDLSYVFEVIEAAQTGKDWKDLVKTRQKNKAAATLSSQPSSTAQPAQE